MTTTSGGRPGSRPPTVEAVEEEMALVLSRMTGAQRLAIAAGMFRTARRMIESHLRAEHPDWDSRQVQAEVARRLAHGAG
jgi:hypothetical protein